MPADLCADNITIAITVYSRRDYVWEAIQSALDQTVPVKVIVVEDCGPDPTLRDFITRRFGGRIEYFRNAKNRGLFDNWQACMEFCQTPWLSILHDDDTLRPNFVEKILSLSRMAPGRALYFGRHARLDNGIIQPPAEKWDGAWRDVDLVKLAEECYLLFPGQLFHVATAQSIGGFRINSYFTGDWDMWFRLALKFGAAQSAEELSVVRGHDGVDRGSSVVVRKGWKWALDNVQRKRNLARLQKEKGVAIPYDRAKLLAGSPMPSQLLFSHAGAFSKRILAYNWWLYIHSRSPHVAYAVIKQLIRLGGPQSLRLASQLGRFRTGNV